MSMQCIMGHQPHCQLLVLVLQIPLIPARDIDRGRDQTMHVCGDRLRGEREMDDQTDGHIQLDRKRKTENQTDEQ